jgi:hypothetical protein
MRRAMHQETIDVREEISRMIHYPTFRGTGAHDSAEMTSGRQGRMTPPQAVRMDPRLNLAGSAASVRILPRTSVELVRVDGLRRFALTAFDSRNRQS